MRIVLINEEQYNLLLKISIEHPILIFQSTDYEYIDKSKFTESDTEAFNKVTEILKAHIVGFVKFNNFRYTKENRLQIRLQYNYGAEDGTMPFTGVGYLLLDELKNGFEVKQLNS